MRIDSRVSFRSGVFAKSARVVAVALLVGSGTGCMGLAGSIEEDRYVAPAGAFSMPVPDLSVGLAIQDGTDKHRVSGLPVGYVSFHDDFGNIRSVQYMTLPAAD